MTTTANAAHYPNHLDKAIQSILENQGQHSQAISELLEKVELIGHYQEKEKIYRDAKEHQRVYSFRHREHNWLKIGYSEDFANRKRAHINKGWEHLGDESGTLSGSEKPLKIKLKKAKIAPVPHSKEIFPITEDLIHLLIEEEWVGITKDLLQKNTQTYLSL